MSAHMKKTRRVPTTTAATLHLVADAQNQVIELANPLCSGLVIAGGEQVTQGELQPRHLLP